MSSKTYISDAPCKKGHPPIRRVSNNCCVQCARDNAIKYYQRHKEKYIKWREQNKDKVRTYARSWARKNANKNKEYRTRHPEKMREYRKKWIANNQDKHEASQLLYRMNNIESILKKQRIYHKENRSIIAARLQRWRKKHPEKNRLYTHKRIARRYGADGKFTASDIHNLLIKQNHRCFYCCKILNDRWHVDHKIPLSRGGTNYPNNLCIACESCNCRKWTIPVDTFVVRLLTE